VCHSMASDWNINRLISWHINSLTCIHSVAVSLTTFVIIIIILIPRTIFIVLSSTAPAISESSLWVIWVKVSQLVGQAANFEF